MSETAIPPATREDQKVATTTTGIADTEAVMRDLGNGILCRAGALLFTTERDLQESLAELFAVAGFAAEREKILGPGERPDFLVDGIAVEVKVKGTADQLERQVRRYLTHAEVAGVLVVTNRARHRGFPTVIDGKPVRVVWVARAF